MELSQFVGIILLSAGVNGHDWNYNRTDEVNGPAHWKDKYPACGGSAQSPIAFKTAETEYDSRLTPFVFVNYDNDQSVFNLTNNGDRAKLVPVSDVPKVSGSTLPGNYTMIHFHFHWGASNDELGSEHHIDDEQYAGEIHMVHLKDGYGEEELKDKPDALVSIALLLKAGGTEHQGYKRLFDHFDKISEIDDMITLGSFRLNELLPSDMRNYYHYTGSRNVPPCSEVVIWYIIKTPVILSDEQFNKFRQLKNGGVPITYNIRPIQATNGRKVYSSWQTNTNSISVASDLLHRGWLLSGLVTSLTVLLQLTSA